MTRSRLMLTFALALTASAFAAPTAQALTPVAMPSPIAGADWSQATPTERQAMLSGIAVGLRSAAAELAAVDPGRSAALIRHATAVRQLGPALDESLTRFYAPPGRRSVPVFRAVRYAIATLLEEPTPQAWLMDATGVPRLGALAGQIPVTALRSTFVKDPTFVDTGRPVGGHRYIAFGDLFGFYLKRFSLAPATPGQTPALKFAPTHVAVTIKGFPRSADGAWAPDIRVIGQQVVLLYCAGRMVKELVWPSYRLRMATAPLAQFTRELNAGRTVHFQDQGVLAGDIAPFGPGDQDFGVIDPQWYGAPTGESYLTYTVVRHGVPNKRYHEEMVYARRVDPRDPRKTLGLDQLVYAGLGNTPDDGVAEAQDVATLGGKPYVFLSSRAGDRDQRLLVAPAAPGMGLLPEGAAKSLLDPGGAPWKAKAVGSSGAVQIGRHMYLVHQGMDATGRFSLGWATLVGPTP